MYKILLLFSLLILFSSCNETTKTYYETGELHEEFQVDKEGKKHGEYIRHHPEGGIAEKTYFKHGLQEGERILYYQNGKIESKSDYINDKLTGKHLVYYDTGELMIDSDYEESTIIGVLKKYYKNGNLMEEVTFANDLENGPFKEYYENGTIKWKGQYLNGDNEFGILEQFDENGALIKEMECDSLKICKTLWEKEKPNEE